MVLGLHLFGRNKWKPKLSTIIEVDEDFAGMETSHEKDGPAGRKRQRAASNFP